MNRSNLKTKKLIPTLEVKPGEKNNIIYQNEDSEKCLICLLKEEIPGKERHAKYPVWKALQIENWGHVFGNTGLGQAEKINRFFCLQMWRLQN